jgi:uncharacterized protein YqjF (DUF2071 family)
MHQQWRELAFLHWRVDPDLVAPMLPAGTRPDVHDGSTWVGLIPFRMLGAGIGRGPAVPWLGSFLETNVRLYSVDEQGRRGVVFRSLESERLAVAAGARAGFGTPYTWARMRLTRRDGVLTYTSRRRLPRPVGAASRVVVRPTVRRDHHAPLDDFLTARFGLHSRWLGRTLWVPNHHPAWELHDAELLELDDDLVAAAGLPGLTSRPPDSVLWSPGVETVFGLPITLDQSARGLDE